MKLLLPLILFFTVSCGTTSLLNAQNTSVQNVNIPFVGTWEWVNGNQTFKVDLFLDDEGDIGGHFSMHQTNNQGQSIVVYRSNKPIGYGHTYGSVIYGGSDGNTLEAGIDDNTVPNPNNYPLLSGKLTMKIVSSGNCIGCVTTATWKVKEDKEMRSEGDNRTLNIPTDITLTKVN